MDKRHASDSITPNVGAQVHHSEHLSHSWACITADKIKAQRRFMEVVKEHMQRAGGTEEDAGRSECMAVLKHTPVNQC